jgi:hypothetical protein
VLAKSFEPPSPDFTHGTKESDVESPDLEPLLRGAANDAERRLLESAKSVTARPGARDEMLAALGLPVQAAPESFVVRFGRLLGNSGGWSLHGVLLALFIGAATGAAVMFASSETPSELAAPSEPPALSPHAPSQAEGSNRADGDLVSAPAITPESLPSAPALTSAPPAKASAVQGAPLPPTDSLGREIARVEAARAALARNEAARAVELLDAYEREFSPGAFALEVSVLRIEALARAGQTDRARRLGARFLAEHPEGPLARRVTATLAAMPGATPPSSVEPMPRSPGD